MNGIILTSDLHCSDGLNLTVCLDYLDHVFSYAKDRGINKVAILGDLMDKASRIKNDMFIPLFKKIESFKDDGFEMWFILGNHDITSTLTNSSLLETFERFGHLINSPQTYEFGDTIVNMVPYTKDPALVPTVNADYLFTHLNITGFDLGKGRIAGEEQQAFPTSMFSNYKKVFTGHYHKRQMMENIEYIGSPYQLSFGDCGDHNKGFVVFDLDTGEEEFVKYTLAPNYVTFSYDALWTGLTSGMITHEDLRNNLVKIVVDKKVDALSKLKSALYNEYNVIDITIEFDAPETEDISKSVSVDMDASVLAMVEEFVSSISVERDGFEITGEELREKFLDLRGELVCFSKE